MELKKIKQIIFMKIIKIYTKIYIKFNKENPLDKIELY